MGQFFFYPFVLGWGLIGRERNGGLDWTYGVVDYSFDWDKNPESRRHGEEVSSIV